MSIELLLDAFTSSSRQSGGGGWSTSKHPRGFHGYFVTSGAQQTDIKRLQHQLGVKADGVFGAQTRQAVIAFQRAHGLQVDGVAGKQTLAALEGKANAAKVKPGALAAAEVQRFRQLTSRNRAATRSTGRSSTRGVTVRR